MKVKLIATGEIIEIKDSRFNEALHSLAQTGSEWEEVKVKRVRRTKAQIEADSLNK